MRCFGMFQSSPKTKTLLEIFQAILYRIRGFQSGESRKLPPRLSVDPALILKSRRGGGGACIVRDILNNIPRLAIQEHTQSINRFP